MAPTSDVARTVNKHWSSVTGTSWWIFPLCYTWFTVVSLHVHFDDLRFGKNELC